MKEQFVGFVLCLVMAAIGVALCFTYQPLGWDRHVPIMRLGPVLVPDDLDVALNGVR